MAAKRTVVVTGASSGIGRAVARAFGADGARVWLGARTEGELKAAAREVDEAGGEGRWARLDVTDDDSIAAFAKAVTADSPRVNVLVNNAGVGASGSIDKLDAGAWRRAIATNLTGPQGRRCVLNVVSVAGKQAFAGNGAYAASKFGLRGWTEALAAELAEDGIRVTGVLPGYVATPLVKGSADAKRMIQPDDLAAQMVALAKMPESIHVDEIVYWPWAMYTD